MTTPPLRTRAQIARILRAAAITVDALLCAVGTTALLLALYSSFSHHPIPRPLPSPNTLAIGGAFAGLLGYVLAGLLQAIARRIDPLPWTLRKADEDSEEEDGQERVVTEAGER